MDADIIAALNGLLEEERADVEALVGLVAMATDTFERQALTAMGGQAVQGCIELHERLAHLRAPISGRMSNTVNVVLKHERIDDRLRAFADVQRHLAGRCEALQARNLDGETRALLATLRAVQMAHAAWAEHRADEFAATRPSDVESSSPAHAVPQGERALTFAAMPATEAPPADRLADSGAPETARAPETPAPDDVSPDAAVSGIGDPASPDAPLDGKMETAGAPAPKPRPRRIRAGAQPVERRTRKQS